MVEWQQIITNPSVPCENGQTGATAIELQKRESSYLHYFQAKRLRRTWRENDGRAMKLKGPGKRGDRMT